MIWLGILWLASVAGFLVAAERAPLLPWHD